MSLGQSLATAIAVLGASLLTVLGSFWLRQWQYWRDGKATAMKERAAVYADLHARAGAFARRVGALALAKRFRSDITEGVYVLLGHRRPIDVFEIYEWVDADFCPLSDAWSKVHLIGSQEAILAADKILATCGDLMDAALTTNSQRNYVARLLRGETQSPKQAEAHQAAMRKLFKELEAFAAIVRKETGQKPAELPLQRSEKLGVTANSILEGR